MLCITTELYILQIMERHGCTRQEAIDYINAQEDE